MRAKGRRSRPTRTPTPIRSGRGRGEASTGSGKRAGGAGGGIATRRERAVGAEVHQAQASRQVEGEAAARQGVTRLLELGGQQGAAAAGDLYAQLLGERLTVSARELASHLPGLHREGVHGAEGVHGTIQRRFHPSLRSQCHTRTRQLGPNSTTPHASAPSVR